MPSDDSCSEQPSGEALHATAISIGGRALLILGASGVGKSRLALALIGASTHRLTIRLVGDDRVLVTQGSSGLVVRGHPRIQGFVERRGLGIIATRFVERAPVRAIVELGPTTSRPATLQNFPCLSIVTSYGDDAEVDRVLRWWRGASTTLSAKPTVAA